MRAEIFSVAPGADKSWLVLFRQPELDSGSEAERLLDESGYRAINWWYGGR